jgi:cytochrome c551/c552
MTNNSILKRVLVLATACFATLLAAQQTAAQQAAQETATQPASSQQEATLTTDTAGAALAQASACYACHHQTEPLIGPPYQAIAARHAGDKAVMVEVLARKIILGGGGNWGVVPMVPNEHVSEADALILARWILEQRPAAN